MKHLKLKDNTNEPFFLIGIIAAESAVKMCWALNNCLSISLSQAEPIEKKNKPDNIEFPVFSFTDDEQLIKYSLIINRSYPYLLIPSLKNIDYFLKITGNTNNLFVKELVNLLRTSTIVGNVILIATNNIKETQYLSQV